MTEELKARIAQINAGTAPAGYKKTKVGIVPEEWDYKPFEEYASVKSKKYNPITDCADYPCIEMEHLQQKTGTLLGTVSSKLQASIKNLFECGDILYGKLRPYLRKYYLAEFNGVCSTEIWVLKAKKSVSNLFLYYTIQSERFNGLCDTSCIGSKMPRADWDYVSQHLFAVPPLPEQQKIAEILTAQDAVIELMQKQIELLQKQKKAFLQKMFLKKGSNVPEIRFAGFTDAWEQRKLGEIYRDIGNAFVGTATPYYVEEGHFYLESNNVKDGQINHNSEIFINDEFYEKQKDKWLHTGDMVMVQSGHVGHAAVIPEELDNSAAHALIMFRNPKVKIEPYFLNYQYQTLKSKKKIDNITTGNTIKHILASDMQEFIVDVTSYEEQSKIASFFLNIDSLITLHQRKLEIEQQKKKALMQLLLTGKVRVKT